MEPIETRILTLITLHLQVFTGQLPSAYYVFFTDRKISLVFLVQQLLTEFLINVT